MEVGRLRSVGNGNQVPTPIPMMPPGSFPASDDVVSHVHNLLHNNWSSVPKNPNLSSNSSSSTFTSNSNISFTNEDHLTNPNNPSYYNNSDELLLTNNPSLRSSPSSMAAMREMIFRIAALQPINIDPEAVKTPKRKNVRISKDPQSVAARHRRERISERIRILQRIVPGGTKMDTASMLDEAIHYLKFLKRQVQSLEKVRGGQLHGYGELGLGFAGPAATAAAADQVWGYHDYMASCYGGMESRGDVSCQQGQSSSGESYGDF